MPKVFRTPSRSAFPSFFLALALTFGAIPGARAEPETPTPKNARPNRDRLGLPGEPDTGKSDLVTGIVTTSIGGGVMIVAATFALFTACGWVEEDDVSDCRDDRNRSLLIGGVVGGGLLAYGIPTILSGAHKRRAWKDWKREHGYDQAAVTMGLAPLRRGGAAVLTWNF